jgi:hypothetical protein
MLKLLLLTLGLLPAAIYSSPVRASSFRYLPLSSSLNRDFHAQVIKPRKKSTTVKQPSREKFPVKARKYQEIRLQDSTKDLVDCERQRSGRSRHTTNPNDINISTTIRIGKTVTAKCND